MTLRYIEVDLDRIIRAYANGFEIPNEPDKEVDITNWFIDMRKSTVIFKGIVHESTDKSEGHKP